VFIEGVVHPTGVRTERAAGSRDDCPPRHLQSLIIGGGGGSDVHVPLSTGGRQGPASDAADVGRTAPEPSWKRSTTLEQEGKGRPAPDLAERRGLASELAGENRLVPEQGSSNRLVKWVCVRFSR
jgi:hypothetical protein